MRWLRPWVIFAGCVLVVVLLDWAEPVLLPVAGALLLTFLLNPWVNGLQRWIRRGPAVILVVTVTIGAMTLLGWGLARQMTSLASDLPRYRETIRQKILDVRNASRGGAVERVQSTLEEIKEDIKKDIGSTDSSAQNPTPVVIADEMGIDLGLTPWLAGLLPALGAAGFVTVLVIFMLLEQRDMRDRIVALAGDSHLATTTKAFDDAAARLSHFLMMQTLVNAIYAVGVGAGLWLFGVPYPLLWAVAAAVLRFIPYVGPWIAAVAPIVVSLAAVPGWTTTFYVVGWFVVLELITNLVLETVFYAGAAGVTQVSLLISLAFWTWLWGPIGLLLATPLTVCLAVLGRHVPGLRVLATLVSDQPVLAPASAFYQRLLARQVPDAVSIVEQQMRAEAPESVFDSLLIPALSHARRDHASGRLSVEEERQVVEATREMTSAIEAGLPAGAEATEVRAGASGDPLRIFGYPITPGADEVTLELLRVLVRDLPVSMEIASGHLLVSELVAAGRSRNYDVICLADLSPTQNGRTRYAVRRLRESCPDVRIIVARWSPTRAVEEIVEDLFDAGASHVTWTMLAARNLLREMAAHGAATSPRPEAAAS